MPRLMRIAGGALLVAAVLGPTAASAHVKWFIENADVSEAPAALGRVVSPLFAAVWLVFTATVFGGYLLDGIAARRWPKLVSLGDRFIDNEEAMVRIAVGAFFLLLWDKGAEAFWVDSRSLLTPELGVHAPWIGAVQFLVAFFVIWRRTCLLSGTGILVLFGWGVTKFGIFHMTDYIFFPMIAAYLMLTTVATPAAQRLRVPLLSGGLAFGLMWTAIEKFVYPQWVDQIVAHHPELDFGFSPGFAIVVAGFVEFTLAFFIMTGQGLVRFGAIFYALIFIAAIPTFGHLDAVGHIPIVGILLVVALHGASPLQRVMGLLERNRVTNAAAITGLYIVTMLGFFGMYYGLHQAEYGNGVRAANLPADFFKVCHAPAGSRAALATRGSALPR